MIRFAVFAAALLFAAAAGAESFVARVITVIDGDTVVVLQGQRKTSVRLAGIDAPEKLQAYGIASRDALATLVLKKNVMVIPKAVDDYGRVIAQLRLGDADVSEVQLRRGMAWENSRFQNDKALLALQTEARRARRGLWASPNPLPPSEFRKTHTPADVVSSDNPACGNKRYCSQMGSCEEATLYLTQCHIKMLDKDGDGVPCENLCKATSR